MWTAGVALQLLAAPLGGFLAAIASARIAFVLNALSFIASAAILARLPRQPGLSLAAGPWEQAARALRAIPRLPVLARLLLMQGIAGLAEGATSALLVVLAEREYGVGGSGFGLWLAVIGLGALLGPLVRPALTRLPPPVTVSAAYVVRGLGDVALGLSGSGFVGGALSCSCTASTPRPGRSPIRRLCSAVADRLRGRAFAVLDVTWQTARLASIAIGGVVAGVVGVRPVFVGGGGLLIVAGILGTRSLRTRPDVDDDNV